MVLFLDLGKDIRNFQIGVGVQDRYSSKSHGHFPECDVIMRVRGRGLGNFRIRGGVQGSQET